LLLDTFHMNMEEGDLAEAILRSGSRLFHFQANKTTGDSLAPVTSTGTI